MYKDGSYKNFNSSLTFDSSIVNYYSYPHGMASNGVLKRDFKLSYADIKVNYSQTESFNYANVTVTKPGWTANA